MDSLPTLIFNNVIYINIELFVLLLRPLTLQIYVPLDIYCIGCWLSHKYVNKYIFLFRNVIMSDKAHSLPGFLVMFFDNHLEVVLSWVSKWLLLLLFVLLLLLWW